MVVQAAILSSSQSAGTTWYNIEVSIRGGVPWHVERRFRNFLTLDAKLTGMLNCLNLPEKGFIGIRRRFNLFGFNQRRQEGLEAYLQHLTGQIENIEIAPPVLAQFLTPGDFIDNDSAIFSLFPSARTSLQVDAYRERQQPPSQRAHADIHSVEGISRTSNAKCRTTAGSASTQSTMDSCRVSELDGQLNKADASTSIKPKATSSFKVGNAVGSGSFGTVYKATMGETGETVAIKKFVDDMRCRNRELRIMKELKHPNVVEFKHAFYTHGDAPGETQLNIVMEYCSGTVYATMRHYKKQGQPVPHFILLLYSYQMGRACAYIHALNICHRDIKPQNLLVEGSSHTLKLCDFGSAKRLMKGDTSVSYICSRWYRAPELIMGVTDYTTNVDIWSVACVTAELILGQAIFAGESSSGQFVEILNILGTPTQEDCKAINPAEGAISNFPLIDPTPWSRVFPSRTSPLLVDFVAQLMVYDPTKRPSGLQCCAHASFDEIRNKQNYGAAWPSFLFKFSTEEEAIMDDELRKKLIPAWVEAKGSDSDESRNDQDEISAAARAI